MEARNQFGYSTFSESLTLLSAFIPAVPESVVTTIEGSQIKVTWDLSTDNGSPVTAYKVFMLEIGSTTYTLEENDCLGASLVVLSSKSCNIDISTLLAAPYNVDGGDHIWAKVTASNVYGESDLSAEGNGAYYMREPDAPISLSEDLQGKTSTTINLIWADGVSNGGTPVIDYRVNMREQGSGDFTPVADSILTQAYTITGLTLGITYEFRVESRNAIGYSPTSDVFTILHALAPVTPDAPVTSNSGQDILISWTAPSNNGAAITSYTITLRYYHGLTYEENV